MLPGGLRPDAGSPVKCGTPFLLAYRRHRDQLQPPTVAEIESAGMMTHTVQAGTETYTSPTGRFLIHYTTSGDDAVPPADSSGVEGIPDYVEWVAAAADSSWRHQVGTLGYTDPVTGTAYPYPVFIENTGNIYGYTDFGHKRGYTGSTYIVIHNNFEEFPSNTDPEGHVKGAIKVTVAHELKHAIQYAATRWEGESDRWAEMDATLMEEVVYDDVNDYYNYLNSSSSIFRNPQDSFYPGSYYHVTWGLFFEEKYGPQFWVEVWKVLQTNPHNIRFIEAVQAVLEHTQAFGRAYTESQLWHFASGADRSPPDYGFEERLNYPDPAIHTSFFGMDSLTTPVSIDPLAANYIEVNPAFQTEGAVRVEFSRSASHIGMGLIAYLKDGRSEQAIISGGEALVLAEQPSWKWNNIERMGIVVTNSSEDSSGSYRMKVITNIPELTHLGQNYPNPFNLRTTIPFNLHRESHVQLKVYDVLGRLVQTLIDETRPRGYYTPKFRTRELSSGVYMYQLVTDEEVLTRKMTLIK